LTGTPATVAPVTTVVPLAVPLSAAPSPVAVATEVTDAIFTSPPAISMFDRLDDAVPVTVVAPSLVALVVVTLPTTTTAGTAAPAMVVVALTSPPLASAVIVAPGTALFSTFG